MLAAFYALSLEKASSAYEAGQVTQAAEWLARVPVERRPANLTGAVHYALARTAVSEQRWSLATGDTRS